VIIKMKGGRGREVDRVHQNNDLTALRWARGRVEEREDLSVECVRHTVIGDEMREDCPGDGFVFGFSIVNWRRRVSERWGRDGLREIEWGGPIDTREAREGAERKGERDRERDRETETQKEGDVKIEVSEGAESPIHKGPSQRWLIFPNFKEDLTSAVLVKRLWCKSQWRDQLSKRRGQRMQRDRQTEERERSRERERERERDTECNKCNPCGENNCFRVCCGDWHEQFARIRTSGISVTEIDPDRGFESTIASVVFQYETHLLEDEVSFLYSSSASWIISLWDLNWIFGRNTSSIGRSCAWFKKFLL
jgi:hypothetical protein